MQRIFIVGLLCQIMTILLFSLAVWTLLQATKYPECEAWELHPDYNNMTCNPTNGTCITLCECSTFDGSSTICVGVGNLTDSKLFLYNFLLAATVFTQIATIIVCTGTAKACGVQRSKIL